MNRYLKNLSKLEFAVTYACTGKCKHCSEGDHDGCAERIDSEVAARAVNSLAKEYDISTVMVFGGEPLLHTGAVYEIIGAAKELGIPKRQLITNGYFTNNTSLIREVVSRLRKCGVNDLLLSVDAFHQEFIPLDTVREFAAEAVRCGIPIRLSPAWLVSREDDNAYNLETRRILESLADLKIPIGDGNVVFPEGNALKYLSEYFADTKPENPYIEDPCDVRCISVSPNGDALDGNIYERDIIEIAEAYEP